MKDLPPGFEDVPPTQDRTVIEACPFQAQADPATEHIRHQIAKEGGQQLFDGEDTYDVIFDMEKQLKSNETIAKMKEETPIKANLLVARVLRRALFTARGHRTDRYLLRYVSDKYRNNTAFTDDEWPSEPDFYESTTVQRYHGTADRFMRTIVGMGDLAAQQADATLSKPFKDTFFTVYQRYFNSLVAYKEAYPAEDVPEVRQDSELNWKLGRRANGDNTLAVQLAHALAYSRQHPDATADDILHSSLSSATILATAARIRRVTFNELGLKDITSDFDAWETRSHKAFNAHATLFVYSGNGIAIPLSRSLTEGNDSYCSANIDIEHTDPEDREHIEFIGEWVQEHSNWPGVYDREGRLLHRNGIFNEATLQLILGASIGRHTIVPALLQILRKRHPENP